MLVPARARMTLVATSPVRDRGSAAVELVILAPVLVVMLLFVVWTGRASGATEQVRHAADEGARAASVVAHGSMDQAASAAVARDLMTNGANCSTTAVSVHVDPAPGSGTVTVTVRCVVEASGTGLLGAAPRTVTASSTEVIDRYRAG